MAVLFSSTTISSTVHSAICGHSFKLGGLTFSEGIWVNLVKL
jgi:hypothetical protein